MAQNDTHAKGQFIHIYGRLLTELDHDVDLIDFDHEHALFAVLSEVGEVRRIA